MAGDTSCTGQSQVGLKCMVLECWTTHPLCSPAAISTSKMYIWMKTWWWFWTCWPAKVKAVFHPLSLFTFHSWGMIVLAALVSGWKHQWKKKAPYWLRCLCGRDGTSTVPLQEFCEWEIQIPESKLCNSQFKCESSLKLAGLFSAAGTGTGTSLRVVQKCVRLSTTSPPHRPTKKVISCSSGTMTTATPRTTSSANTRKVNHQICAVVSGCFTGWSNSVIWGGSRILKLRICLLVFQKWFPKSDYCIHCLLLIIIMVECTMFGVSSSLSLFSFLFFSTPAIFVCMIKLWRFVFTPSVNTLFHLFYFSTGAEFFFL